MGANDGRPEGPDPRLKRPARGGRTLSLLGAIRSSGLPPTQRLVLCFIALRVGWTTRKGRPAGTCHPGVARIAEDTGLAPSSVNRLLVALVAAGWLEITPRSTSGMSASNQYRVTPPGLPR